MRRQLGRQKQPRRLAIGVPRASDGAAERLQRLIARLSVREQAVVSMQLSGLKQRDIASILGLTQPTVSYVVTSARKKMRLMATWEGVELSSRDVRSDLDTYFTPTEVDVLVSIFETTCHSETARLMRLSQRRVHELHIRALEKMRSLAGLARAARVFGWLRDNYRLSHYARGRGKWVRGKRRASV
jgi:DNA-directed RNA polymerase specialized sigma24 family protein